MPPPISLARVVEGTLGQLAALDKSPAHIPQRASVPMQARPEQLASRGLAAASVESPGPMGPRGALGAAVGGVKEFAPETAANAYGGIGASHPFHLPGFNGVVGGDLGFAAGSGGGGVPPFLTPFGGGLGADPFGPVGNFTNLQRFSDQGVQHTIAETGRNIRNQYSLAEANSQANIELNGQRMEVSFSSATGKNMKSIGSDAKDSAG